MKTDDMMKRVDATFPHTAEPLPPKPMNLRQALAAGAKEPDLDAALRPIQEILGQTDGGPASHFFSGPKGEKWELRGETDRWNILLEYCRFELSYI